MTHRETPNREEGRKTTPKRELEDDRTGQEGKNINKHDEQ